MNRRKTQMNAEAQKSICVHPRSSVVSVTSSRYRLRRSRRALRFLLPTLRRRRGLAMRMLLSSQFDSLLFDRVSARRARRRRQCRKGR